MKKNINIIALLVLLLSFAGCSDDKEFGSFYGNDHSKPVTLTVANPTNIKFYTADFSLTVTENDEEALEVGILCSDNEKFVNPIVLKAEAPDFTTTTTDLIGSTKYYVKAYAVTINGIYYSDEKTFTTEVSPLFEDNFLYGEYTEDDYTDSGNIESLEGPIVIAEMPNGGNRILITNFWEGGETIVAFVDFEKKEISIPNTQIIYIDSSYGNCQMYNWDMETDDIYPGGSVIATYDENTITFEPWAAVVSIGVFSIYTKSVLTKMVEE